MSARLFKHDNGFSVASFTAFAIPEDTGDSTPLDLPPPIEPQADPESEAVLIIDAAMARSAEIERETRQNMQSLIREEVDLVVASAVEPLREELKRSIEEICTLRSTLASQVEAELVRLAIEIARKVVHRELSIDPQIVLGLARVALSRVQNRIAATIHLHPEDFNYVDTNRDQLETVHAVTLIEDRSVGRGGCLIRTAVGEIDARIEQQFSEIEEALLQD